MFCLNCKFDALPSAFGSQLSYCDPFSKFFSGFKASFGWKVSKDAPLEATSAVQGVVLTLCFVSWSASLFEATRNLQTTNENLSLCLFKLLVLVFQFGFCCSIQVQMLARSIQLHFETSCARRSGVSALLIASLVSPNEASLWPLAQTCLWIFHPSLACGFQHSKFGIHRPERLFVPLKDSGGFHCDLDELRIVAFALPPPLFVRGPGPFPREKERS